MPARILLVDDSRRFIESAERFFADELRVTVVGSALSGKEALDQVARLNPDLVLMDVAMPGMDGLEATQHIKARANAPLVIILTFYDTPSSASPWPSSARCSPTSSSPVGRPFFRRHDCTLAPSRRPPSNVPPVPGVLGCPRCRYAP